LNDHVFPGNAECKGLELIFLLISLSLIWSSASNINSDFLPILEPRVKRIG
jgi:hypothetical protein